MCRICLRAFFTEADISTSVLMEGHNKMYKRTSGTHVQGRSQEFDLGGYKYSGVLLKI